MKYTHIIKHSTRITTLLFATVILCVSGCASQPNQLRYYVLHAYVDAQRQPQSAPQSTTATKPLVLTQLTLPRYLRQDALVHLESNTTMSFATRHLWAEPLKDAIPKTIMTAFNVLDDTQLFEAHTPMATDAARLRLVIHHFYADFTGHVVLQGEYWLQADASAHAIDQHYSFQFSLPLEQDGYTEAVRQQRQLLTLLARDIHTHYKRL